MKGLLWRDLRVLRGCEDVLEGVSLVLCEWRGHQLLITCGSVVKGYS